MTTKKTTLKIKKLYEDSVLPEIKTEGSVGYDLSSHEDVRVTRTYRHEATEVHTGIAVEIPEGYHGQIYLRSSIGKNTKIRLANGTGIIDPDYRGELILLVENIGEYGEFIKKGDRVAQLVLAPNVVFEVEEVKDLKETKRNTKGLGSTGK